MFQKSGYFGAWLAVPVAVAVLGCLITYFSGEKSSNEVQDHTKAVQQRAFRPRPTSKEWEQIEKEVKIIDDEDVRQALGPPIEDEDVRKAVAGYDDQVWKAIEAEVFGPKTPPSFFGRLWDTVVKAVTGAKSFNSTIRKDPKHQLIVRQRQNEILEHLEIADQRQNDILEQLRQREEMEDIARLAAEDAARRNRWEMENIVRDETRRAAEDAAREDRMLHGER
jgi:hypothetical protein